MGFLVPPKIEAFGEANFVVVDTHAVQFNGALDMCKLAGAVLFCIGGTSMAGCLLMSVSAKSYSKEEKFLQQRFKERIADIKAHTQPITRAPGPGETKIPVTLSRVHNVQPLAATWNLFHPTLPSLIHTQCCKGTGQFGRWQGFGIDLPQSCAGQWAEWWLSLGSFHSVALGTLDAVGQRGHMHPAA